MRSLGHQRRRGARRCIWALSASVGRLVRAPARVVAASTMALCLAGGIVAAVSVVETAARPPRSQSASAPPLREVLDQYCITCHNERLRAAGLALDAADPTRPEADPALWERVIAKLRAGSMPPAMMLSPAGWRRRSTAPGRPTRAPAGAARCIA